MNPSNYVEFGCTFGQPEADQVRAAIALYSGAWIENGPERSVKLTQLVPINPRHRAFTLIRVAGMNRNIFYIIGVIVVIVIVLKLLGVF